MGSVSKVKDFSKSQAVMLMYTANYYYY